MHLSLRRASGLVILLAATALAGCAAPPNSQARRDPMAGRAPDQERSPNTLAGPADDLAARAERDREWLLSRDAESERSLANDRAQRDPIGQIQWSGVPSQRDESAWAPPEMSAQPDLRRRPSQPELPKTSMATPPAEVPASQPATNADSTQMPPGNRGKGWPNDASSRELLAALSRELYRDATFSKAKLPNLLLISAISLVNPDNDLVVEALPGLTVREREMVAAFQQFYRNLNRRLDGTGDAEFVIDDALASLQRDLSQVRQLALPTVALCSRVGGFGDYDKFDRYAFVAHTSRKVIVYVEVDGFTSELNKDAAWVTRLSQQLEILSDRDGIPVWREDWQTAVDVTNKKRQDYFQRQIVTLPKALSVGRYQLKVRLRDEKSRSEAEVAIPFEMVADPRLAATDATH